MKAERVNPNQIRFTLNAEDLSARNICLSELSYGSDKAKALFQDMMKTAKQEFGFDFSSQPVVIEAVPLAKDSIMITVTRIRKAVQDRAVPSGSSPADPGMPKAPKSRQTPKDEAWPLFIFSDFSVLCRAASLLSEDLPLKSRLYWDAQSSLYYLQVRQRSNSEAVLPAIRVLYEFASDVDDDPLTAAYLKEHARCVLNARALTKLRQIT